MLKYLYTKENDRLYVHDDESGYFSEFNKYTGEWEIPVFSFSVVDHDNDDLCVISDDLAKEMSNGASFEEDYREFVALLESVRARSKKKK